MSGLQHRFARYHGADRPRRRVRRGDGILEISRGVHAFAAPWWRLTMEELAKRRKAPSTGPNAVIKPRRAGTYEPAAAELGQRAARLVRRYLAAMLAGGVVEPLAAMRARSMGRAIAAADHRKRGRLVGRLSNAVAALEAGASVVVS